MRHSPALIKRRSGAKHKATSKAVLRIWDILLCFNGCGSDGHSGRPDSTLCLPASLCGEGTTSVAVEPAVFSISIATERQKRVAKKTRWNSNPTQLYHTQEQQTRDLMNEIGKKTRPPARLHARIFSGPPSPPSNPFWSRAKRSGRPKMPCALQIEEVSVPAARRPRLRPQKALTWPFT
jgi:hypothetical protein